MYTAYYMPDDNPNLTKNGFETERAAWDYITQHLCKHCKETLDKGYVMSTDQNGNEVPFLLTGVWDTGCGAEWLVGLTKDFDNAKNIEDIWEAGGFVKIEKLLHQNECEHEWKFNDVDKDTNIIWECEKCHLIKTDYTKDNQDGI